ncbi:DUF1565 domain-containing protein [candidate division KSB1 bacterium]|nr:DUF1565 domain-containing protein [candidate division KSB1 bacterium]
MCNIKLAMMYGAFCLCLVLIDTRTLANEQSQKVWRQTTQSDFLNGNLDSVVVTRLVDGEVQLPHPFVRASEDTVDNSLLRFAVFNQAGEYLTLAIQDRQLFAAKHAADGSLLIDRFRVDADTTIFSVATSAACFNDQTNGFAILWSAQLNPSRERVYYNFIQFYDASGAPIGSHQLVNENVMIQASGVSVLFDDFGTWWVFWEQGNWDKGAVYLQKFTGSGEKLGTNRLLNPENYSKHEYFPIAAKNSRGEFVVAWTAIVDQEPSSNYEDAYLRFFNKDGTPKGPPIRVDDDPGEGQQRITDICFDRHDNLLLAWIDRRGNPDGNFARVYAQLFSADGVALNRNHMIADIDPYQSGGLNDVDIMLLADDLFQLSWEAWHMGDGPSKFEIIMNQWRVVPVRDGAFTSTVFDAGPGGADFSELSRVLSGDPNTTHLQFQLRSSSTPGSIHAAQWYGPTSNADFYTSETGQITNPVHDGDRYIQYKANLATDIPGATPGMDEVALWFSTLDSIAPQTPIGLAIQRDVRQIRLDWTANIESDLKSYKLYRSAGEADFDRYWTKEIPGTATGYVDTDVLPGFVYAYAIAAVDSNSNESALSETVSGKPFGDHIYVDEIAAAGGNGSVQRPFATITTGLTAAQFGDTVNVRPGEYSEMITIGPGIALVGSGANVTKIHGMTNEYRFVECADSSMIKGFTIINHFDGSAIRCEQTSPLITENVLINYGGEYAIGIEHLYSSPQITKNIISGFGVGIRDFLSIVDTTSPGYIQNNIIIESNNYAIQLEFSLTAVINNTIVQETGRGISLGYTEGVIPVMSNIVHITNDSRGEGIIGDQDAIVCTYNNVVAANAYNGFQPGLGCISEEPHFRQERPNDFRLLPGSPGINAGNPAPEFNDRDGSRNDMGAFGGPDPIPGESDIEYSTMAVISSASGFPGDTISVSIILSDLRGLQEARFDVSFDGQLLEAIHVATGEATETFALDWQAGSDAIHIALTNATELLSGSGTITTIQFAVNAACHAGEASPLSLDNLNLTSSSGKPFRILQVTDGAFVVHLGSSGGRYVFVDNRNSGDEDGSRYFPYRRISAAIAHATSGDTVLVAAGDYNETIVMRENVYVKGMGALVTRLFGEEHTVVVFNSITESGISGLTLDAGDGGFPTIVCNNAAPLIAKNRIMCGGGSGIGIDCNSANPEISNNLFESDIDGIWIACDNASPHIHHNIFEGNELIFTALECRRNAAPLIEQNIFNSPQYGEFTIYARDASPRLLRNIFRCVSVTGAVIYGENSQGLDIYNNTFQLSNGEMCYGIQLKTCADAAIINNTFYTIQGTAIIYDQESSLTNMNNIFAGADFNPVHSTSQSPMDYCAIWDYETAFTGITPGIGNIVADPQFVNPASQNYHLLPTSPCIDTGNPATGYDDLDGSRNDMGAYGGPFADSSGAAIQQAVLSIGSTDANPGQVVTLPLESQNVNGVAEIKLTLQYDPAVMTIQDVRTTALTKSFSLTTDFTGTDSATISLISPVAIHTDQGALVDVCFKVHAESDTGTTSPVDIKHATLCGDVSQAISIQQITGGHISIIGKGLDVQAANHDGVPNDFQLSANYPNPFNAVTHFRYGVPAHGANVRVTIRVYNILGQLTRELVNGNQAPGYHTVTWDGTGQRSNYAPSGIYMCVLEANEIRRVHKILLLK